MRKILMPILFATLTVAAILSAQSIVESATAAAGGSAAGVAGKKVSEGLDAVFGSVGGITQKAADQGKSRKIAPSVPALPTVRRRIASQEPEPAAPITNSKSRIAVPSPGKRQAAVPHAPAARPATQAVVTPPVPVRPEPTRADFQTLSAGNSREDVVSKLGRPASRITMHEDGALVEIYKYKNQGGTLGSIRVVDGKVSDVKSVQ